MKYFILLLLILSYQNIFADAGAFTENPVTGNIIPYTNNNVRMVSEVVCFSNNRFDIVYYFRNESSKPQKVLCGFPIKGKFSEPNDLSPRQIDDYLGDNKDILSAIKKYYKFQFYVENTKYSCKLKKVSNKEYDYLFLTDVVFPPNKIIIISNSYYQEWSESFSQAAYFTFYKKYLNYILKTGSQWKGSITSCKIIIYDNLYLDSYSMIKYGFSVPYITLRPNKNNKIYYFNKLAKIEWDIKNTKPNFNIECEIKNDLMRIIDGYKIDDDYIKYFQDKQKFMEFLDYINVFISEKTSNEEDLLDFKERMYNEDNIDFIINSIYAINGYVFENNDLKEFYNKFKWYKPDSRNFYMKETDLKKISSLKKIKEIGTL